MGDVWLARHVALDRPVAVKVLRSNVAQGAERSLLEARTLAKLRHPAVVEVFDCGLDEAGTAYIVMEFLIGKTLAASLAQSGPLGAVCAVQLLLPVLHGLAAVHAAGVIHRDLKPENIMLVPTNTGSPLGVSPKLIDFGIARDGQQAPSRLTATGTFVGTPQYMAPEQLLGSAGDVRSDLWSIERGASIESVRVPPRAFGS